MMNISILLSHTDASSSASLRSFSAILLPWHGSRQCIHVLVVMDGVNDTVDEAKGLVVGLDLRGGAQHTVVSVSFHRIVDIKLKHKFICCC